MIKKKSPWENMAPSSQRRANTKHDLFWIIDFYGHYGLCIESKVDYFNVNEKLNLKGISIIKRNIDNKIEFFLILNNKEEWEIFLSLCEDLISVTNLYESNLKMIKAVETRLNRWQQLLKQNHNLGLSLEKQMGLFTELLCLKDIVAVKEGLKQAIVSWVGPNFDKQDFLMHKAVIEVKSHRTSKGEIVNISSLQQLQCEKEPFFLLSCALSIAENGLTVVDIVKSIRSSLLTESSEIVDIFENKLIEYGFIPEFHNEPLHKFILDKQKMYYVSETFPKIIPKDVKRQITSVKYTIDLSQCSDLEVNINSYLEEDEDYDYSRGIPSRLFTINTI